MKRVKVKTSINKSRPIFTKRFYFILIGVFIISLMVVSVLQFGGDNDDEENGGADSIVDYNGYVFNNVNGKWVLDVNGQFIAFDYLPGDVEGLYLEDVNLGNKVYIAVDPNDDMNSYFIQRIGALLRYKGVIAVESCIIEEGCGDIPLVDCGMDKDIILLNKGNNGVYKDRSCFVLKGDDEYLVKAVDLLYYKLLGVL